jgi:hypothetical protein
VLAFIVGTQVFGAFAPRRTAGFAAAIATQARRRGPRLTCNTPSDVLH